MTTTGVPIKCLISEYDTSKPEFWGPIGPKEKARLRQIARYLHAHWPTPFPTKLRFERIAMKHSCVAETYREGAARFLVIRIDPRAAMYAAIDSLVHEHAHAVVWSESLALERKRDEAFHPDHPPFSWGAVYAAMTTKLYDDGGMDESDTW